MNITATVAKAYRWVISLLTMFACIYNVFTGIPKQTVTKIRAEYKEKKTEEEACSSAILSRGRQL